MSSTTSTLNLGTFLLFAVIAVTGLSVMTLMVYWFVGRDPLRWNAIARVEAAQPPAGLIGADNAYHFRQWVIRLVIAGVIVAVVARVAPEQSAALRDDLISLLGELWRVVSELIAGFLASQACKC